MFSLDVTLFISFPSGVIQVIVGVGKPSDTHFSVTVWPMQDLDVDEVMFRMVALSVDRYG